MRLLHLLVAMLLFPLSLLAAQPDLWLYYSVNLLPEDNLKPLDQVWRRAAAAGYSKVLLADYKFSMLDRLGANTRRYMEHVGRVRKLADELKLEIVPAVFPIGYSNALLANDPNLAEGLPVRNALFVVKGGEGRLVADPAVSLNLMPDWFDSSYTFSGAIATSPGHKANARMVWEVNVAPYRCYHVSVKVKTTNYTGQPEIKPIVGGKSVLSFTSLHTKKTQDWAEEHIVFDSLDNKALSIYMGVWGDATGQLQWRDWRIEEVGLLNVLRRPGAPCIVEGYTEGKDYQPISDPRLGVIPWPGDYETWHTPPTIKTSLPDGTKLRVSWYFPTVIQSDQVMCCPSDPKTLELLADQARSIRDAFHPRGLMMSHDEIRLLNWDESCQKRKLTPGQILAENVAYCTKLLPSEQVYVWSDMFDPYHNAVDNYYMVNGSLADSWKGLEKRVTIMNWNFDNRTKSLRFFADRGHAQVIAAYYDAPLEHSRQWLDGAKGVPNITGVMYTTWENNYADLEAFAKLVRTSIQP